MTVHVPDRPGVLAGITQALGAERINIEDFELRHFSPERGGVLTMLVSGEGEAERAAACSRRRATASRSRRSSAELKSSLRLPCRAALALPGDKSISHRAVLIGAIADGESRIAGFGRSGDTESTIAAVAGARGRGRGGRATSARARASGLRGLRAPAEPIDCGNAGTLAAAARRGSSPASTGSGSS